MNPIVNLKNSKKYSWGKACFGWHLLYDIRLSIIQEEMGIATSEQLHYHNQTQQFFYILNGKATFILDGNHHELSRGDGIHVKPKSIHSILNNSNQKLEFLVISEPHSHTDKIKI